MSRPTTLVRIEAAERRLAMKLPAAHRRLLLERNGGDVEVVGLRWEVVPVMDDSTPELARETEWDVVAITAQAREWPGFPREAVVAADDGCGNYLVYLPLPNREELAPAVYAWWHEGDELELVAPDVLVAIAES